MQNSYLGLLGLAKRAGKLEVGDEAARAAISAGKTRLVIIASDVSDRTRETFEFIADSAGVACVKVEETRAELGNALGRRPTAVIAVCDIGLAAALAKNISSVNEDAKNVAAALEEKSKKIAARKNKGKRKK